MQCASTGCEGSGDGCHAHHIWSGSLLSGIVYGVSFLRSGSISYTGACGSGYCPYTHAFSVRLGFAIFDFSIFYRYRVRLLICCATSILQALCSAQPGMAAVLGARIMHVIPITYGQVPRRLTLSITRRIWRGLFTIQPLLMRVPIRCAQRRTRDSEVVLCFWICTLLACTASLTSDSIRFTAV